MDIRSVIFTPNGGIQQVASITGNYTHADVAAAKSATGSLIGGPSKANYASGYDVAIIDLDSRKVISWAGQPKPSLTWSDVVSPTSPTT